MRVLRGRPADLAADRAETEAMVEWTRDVGRPALRVWRPARHVAFGRRDARAQGYQRARTAAKEAGFPPVEREVGGRAVAHTGTSVAVAHAVPDDDLRAGLTERYESATAAIQRALWRLGVPAQRGEPADSFCPGSHSLSWEGKIAGLAQRVRRDVALVGAVVLVTDHEAVASVLEPVYEALEVPFDPATVGSVDRAGGRADPDEAVAEIESALLGDAEPEVEHVGE